MEILVDKKGYEEEIARLEKLKMDFEKNARDKALAMQNDPGNSWHDNFAFESLDLNEQHIVSMIKEQKNRITRLKVLEEDYDKDCINVSDSVFLELIFEDGETEYLTVTLFASNCDVLNGGVSINSPLGRSIYKKKIGSVVNYYVNEKKVIVKIINKQNWILYLDLVVFKMIKGLGFNKFQHIYYYIFSGWFIAGLSLIVLCIMKKKKSCYTFLFLFITYYIGCL